MTLLRFKNKPVNGDFNNFMDDLFTGFPSLLRTDVATSSRKPFIPVNITETEDGYSLDVVAPGLEKEDFKISLEKDLLTISAGTRQQEEEKNEKVIRREYKFQSFSRSFTLDQKINAEGISAKYVNGVLTLNLPHKAEVKEATKQITIQ